MNTTGKSLLAAAVLATLLGGGWWLLDRGSAPRGSAAISGTPSDAATAVSADLLNELDASVRVIAETVAVSGNVAVALAMIDILDARLARQESAAFVAELRKALAADRQTLVQLQQVDVAALARQLDALVADIDTMPLISAPKPLMGPAGAASGTSGASNGSGTGPASGATAGALPSWQQMLSGLQARLAEVIRIRRVENPEAVFLTPEQGALVAERLRFRVLSARLALISRQPALLASDLAQAITILDQAFDPLDPRVRAHRQVLDSLAKASSKLMPPASMASSAVLAALRSRASGTAAKP